MEEEKKPEEPKPEEPKEESKATDYLEQVRAEKEELMKARDESKVLLDELRKLRAEEIISGKADAGGASKKKEELSPLEYKNMIEKGIIPE